MEVDEIIAVFFDAFTNHGGAAPNIDVLYRLFLPEALIVKNVGSVAEVLDVAGFVEPRREILTNGTLVDFREWEVSQTTETFGNIAHRFSRYEKSWNVNGEQYKAAGAKSIQFVRTPAGWKIASLTWDDD